MKRVLIFLLILVVALSGEVALAAPDTLVTDLLKKMTDIEPLLLTLQKTLEVIHHWIFSLLLPAALLAVAYGMVRTVWAGPGALGETGLNTVLAVILVSLSLGLWTASIKAWNGAKNLGSQSLQATATQTGQDLKTLSTSIDEFMLASYAVSVSSGRSEGVSDATTAPLPDGAGKSVEGGFTAVALFTALLFGMTMIFYLFVLVTGFIVTLNGAFYPMIALNLILSGPGALDQAYRHLSIFFQALFTVLLVPMIFGFALNLMVKEPVRQLTTQVEAVKAAQADLENQINGYVGRAVACNALCEVTFKEDRDRLVAQLSSSIAQTVGMLRGVAVVLLILGVAVVGVVWMLRRFEAAIIAILGGMSARVLRSVMQSFPTQRVSNTVQAGRPSSAVLVSAPSTRGAEAATFAYTHVHFGAGGAQATVARTVIPTSRTPSRFRG